MYGLMQVTATGHQLPVSVAVEFSGERPLTRRPAIPRRRVFSQRHSDNATGGRDKNPAGGRGHCGNLATWNQWAFRRLPNPIPARPTPSNANVAGSGTVMWGAILGKSIVNCEGDPLPST